jgi:predicted metal-dependent HD superfamily phosphohydrolase
MHSPNDQLLVALVYFTFILLLVLVRFRLADGDEMAFINAKTTTYLSELYGEAGRFYHNLSHVKALIALLDHNRNVIADPDAVEAAIWFHDAIYDSKEKDNEARSAGLAVKYLGDQTDQSAKVPTAQQIEKIRIMIEATTKHALPVESLDEQALADCAKFLDMDLSILASEPERFDEYEDQVRREYAWVDDEGWRKGRAAVLETFLQRPKLFFSDILGPEAEERARGNLRRSIERLKDNNPADSRESNSSS